MTHSKKNTIIITYLLAITTLIWGAFISDVTDFMLITVGAMTMMIPWIMCVLDASKKKRELAWLAFLVLFGTVAIPVYLITELKNMESNSNSTLQNS
tara:strand:- start:31051 stop:31341 length:291 start_codon:yes stop_codon:yes gene_type:complete